jgi:hypothetical protein
MRCHGAARIVLTAPRSYEGVALHRGACEKLLRDGKLATSSSIVYIDHPVWQSHREEAKRGSPSGPCIPRNEGAMMSLLLPSATTGVSLIAGWCVIVATPRGQSRTSAMMLPHGCEGLHVLRMTVLWTFRRPFMGRPVPRQLLRNELLDLPTIVPATAYHRRSYAERYSRSMGWHVRQWPRVAL